MNNNLFLFPLLLQLSLLFSLYTFDIRYTKITIKFTIYSFTMSRSGYTLTLPYTQARDSLKKNIVFISLYRGGIVNWPIGCDYFMKSVFIVRFVNFFFFFLFCVCIFVLFPFLMQIFSQKFIRTHMYVCLSLYVFSCCCNCIVKYKELQEQ